jgi:hypothetical protein
VKPAIVSIEGTDGKIVILVTRINDQRKLRIAVESFLEDDGTNSAN